MPVEYIELNWQLPKLGDRNELRKSLVLKFLEEEPGEGKGDLATRYKYIIEKSSDNRNIFLIRPANLKNGFDFQIKVENWNNRRID